MWWSLRGPLVHIICNRDLALIYLFSAARELNFLHGTLGKAMGELGKPAGLYILRHLGATTKM